MEHNADQSLLEDAAKGRLRDTAVIKKHLERMLTDPRSEKFVHNFVWSWLHLDNSVEMAPDQMKFYEFHRNRINRP